jgi:hypothetical protein
VDGVGRYVRLTGNLQWLAPNTMFDCRLYVDKSEFTLGIPSDNAFACLEVPPGRMQFAVNDPQLATVLTAQRWSPNDAPSVDASLRDAVRRGRAAVSGGGAR